MRPESEAPARGVYWMEGSKRRQALEWLARDDLSDEERRALEAFVRDYRTNPAVTAAGRRALLNAYDRVARRLACAERRPTKE